MRGGTPVLVEGGETVKTHWWVAAPASEFTYLVYVVRLHEYPDDERSDWQEGLDENGAWHRIPEGGVLPHAIRISQRLAAAMGESSPLDRPSIAESLEALAVKIIMGVAG